MGTVVNPATLATFRVPVRPTTVPRSTVYRFRVPADRDLSEVLHRLTERDVEVLEIRRCAEPRRRTVPDWADVAPREDDDPDGVVVAFRARGIPTPR